MSHAVIDKVLLGGQNLSFWLKRSLIEARTGNLREWLNDIERLKCILLSELAEREFEPAQIERIDFKKIKL